MAFMLRDRICVVSGKFGVYWTSGHGVKAAFRHMADPSVALALSFGLGLAPWMPGTFGAAGAFLVYPFLMPLPWAAQAAVALLLLLAGCAICGRAARVLGGEDPSAIVWDETVGMLITLVLVPATPLTWVLGFLAFRVLDINKPWIIGAAERRFRGGTAIMADDALAGLGAAGITWLILEAVVLLTRA